MAWFGHHRRGRRGDDPQHSQVHLQQYPGGNTASHAVYATPAAAATTYSVQSQTPYTHQTASTVHLSSGNPHKKRNRHDYSLGSKPPHSSAKWQSCTNLSGMVSHTVEKANFTMTSTMTELETQMRECLTSSVDMYGTVLKKLDYMITSMDEGLFTQKDDMVSTYPTPTGSPASTATEKSTKTTALSCFSKVYLYHNSRLPPQLPPLQIHPQTYGLLHLAAQYSLNVYKKPLDIDNSYFNADARHGTKAMMIKSLAIDDMNTIVLAIRGTQSFRDWAVNMRTEPRSPRGFLNDPLNLCHAGFLSVAQRMVAPVAARLRELLAENPNRTTYSLLLTGHSAGGAVASLLYAHMLSAMRSEITHLHGFFRRIHCITFGAPPITLRPLYPSGAPNALFFSFINEGDPVPRADKSYVTSLMNLYISPAPFSTSSHRYARLQRRGKPAPAPTLWRVPPATLSLAGQVVVLRRRHVTYPGEIDVEACVTNDAVVRQVVFGDPLMHMMDLYARRVYELAVNAKRWL